jgi:hypothetical protein
MAPDKVSAVFLDAFGNTKNIYGHYGMLSKKWMSFG